MIFNGIKKDYIKVHLDLFRPPTPPIEFHTRQRPRGGSRVRKKRFTELILPVPVTIIGRPTIEDLNEDITSWLIHKDPKQLVLGGANRYYLAEYESMELESRKYRARGNIYFYLAEGYRYGATRALNITTTISYHTIHGQLETSWKSKTTFIGARNQFTLESNKGFITINYNFIAGDILEIDYKTRSIKLNGNRLDVGLSLESVWFELNAGYMELRASHATQLTYTETYY